MFTETQKQELRRKGYQEYEIQRIEVYGNEKQRQEMVEKIIKSKIALEINKTYCYNENNRSNNNAFCYFVKYIS